MKLLTKLLIPALLAIALPCCHTTDPEYTKLIESARTNVSPNAVVGTWYSRTESKNLMMDMGGEVVMTIHANGTWTSKSNISGRAGIMAMPSQSESKTHSWKYEGNGVWTTSTTFGHKGTWRLSNGKLLVENKASTGGLGSFIGREVYVNAKDQKAVEDVYRKDSTTQDSAWGL